VLFLYCTEYRERLQYKWKKFKHLLLVLSCSCYSAIVKDGNRLTVLNWIVNGKLTCKDIYRRHIIRATVDNVVKLISNTINTPICVVFGTPRPFKIYRLKISFQLVPNINERHLAMKVGVAQSVQCLTTNWTTRRSGFDPRQEQRIFLLTSVSKPALRSTQPPVQWVLGVLSPGQSAAGASSWPLTPSSVEVKNE
jgi:hypothetical protein